MDQLLTEQEIRDELASLLQNNEVASYSKILSLSSELAKFDKGNIRFTVDAGVIDREECEPIPLYLVIIRRLTV